MRVASLPATPGQHPCAPPPTTRPTLDPSCYGRSRGGHAVHGAIKEDTGNPNDAPPGQQRFQFPSRKARRRVRSSGETRSQPDLAELGQDLTPAKTTPRGRCRFHGCLLLSAVRGHACPPLQQACDNNGCTRDVAHWALGLRGVTSDFMSWGNCNRVDTSTSETHRSAVMELRTVCDGTTNKTRRVGDTVSHPSMLAAQTAENVPREYPPPVTHTLKGSGGLAASVASCHRVGPGALTCPCARPWRKGISCGWAGARSKGVSPDAGRSRLEFGR